MSMYDAENIMRELRALQVKIERLRTNIGVILTDPKVSLEDKEAILNNTDVRITKDWYVDVKKLDGEDICWYDEFYVEKYQTVCIINIIELIREKAEDEDDWSQAECDFVIAQLLNCGYTHFQYDW